jgi:hypothetical protein
MLVCGTSGLPVESPEDNKRLLENACLSKQHAQRVCSNKWAVGL